MDDGEEFLAVDVHAGGRVAEAVGGLVVVGIVVAIPFDGLLRVVLLVVGSAAVLAHALFFVGPHRLWFEGDTLVEQRPRGVRRFRLLDLTDAEASFVPYKGTELMLRMRSGQCLTIGNLNDDTQTFRHDLGRRLREYEHPALARAVPSTLQALGLS